MRLVTCICISMIGTLCALAASIKPQAKLTCKTEVLTVFITGNELGELQPCGCSGGQIGGFSRRSAVLDSVPDSKRLIVDTGLFVEKASEQELIKFNIIIQAFSMLDYDLVNLTEKDIEIAKGLGLLDSIGSVFNVISSHNPADVNLPARFTKQLLLGEKPVTITVAAFDVNSAPIKQAGKLFACRSKPQTVNILILNRCDTDIIASVAKTGIIDCLICPAESDEPRRISEPNKIPLVISPGRYGKYVGKLEIRAVEGSDKLKLGFSAAAVTEDLPQDKSLLELYKIYQQLVKEAGLLEQQPRFALPNGIEYVGSKSCKFCHEYEYEKWSNKPHAHAYATLERVGSQFDPQCVICHVVGMEYESGFVSEEKTGHLKNVGCESCHGPGMEHIRTFGRMETDEPKLDCTDCHNPEHSTDFADNEQLYLEKMIHWPEQNAAGNVKTKRDTEE